MHLRSLNPSISALLAFEAAARYGNFTKAAAALSLSQSAVSRQIQSLESLLHASLFERIGHTIKLTPEGEFYAREISEALLKIRRASMRVHGSKGRHDVLRLAVLPIFATKWLMPKLNDFCRQYPQLIIDVHARADAFDLDMSGMDACITMGDNAWPGLEAMHIIDASGVVVMSPTLYSQHPISRPADLLKQNLLQITSHFSLWNDCLLDNGLDPRKARLGAQYEYTEHLICACVGGLGVGLVSDIFVAEQLRDGSLVSPEIKGFKRPKKSYFLIHSPSTAQHPVLMLFKQWLAEQLAPSQDA